MPPDPHPADQYSALWDGGPPDLDSFLAGAGAISSVDLVAILRADQRRRWEAGVRWPAEEYVRRLPRPDREAALDLVYNEYLIGEELGERVDPESLCRRFPDLAAALREQIAFHSAVRTKSGTQGDITAPAPPTPPSPDDPLPRRFGRYELRRLIARGGMGAVYLAHDTQLGRDVALKIPRFDPNNELAATERFRREARAYAAVSHANLCPVYDVGRVDGTDYLTMPFVAGGTLAAVSRTAPVPPADAVRLVLRVADAMEAAHRAGVIHRDLKPSNILLDDRGEPVVADFGLARRVGGDDASVTLEGAVVGTVAYIPPEQIGCLPDQVGPRSDVYSLGVILYELLTGRLPFNGTPGEILRQVISDEPPRPRAVRPGLSRRLEQVCLTAMAKKAARRYASMAEFAAALRQAAARPVVPLWAWGTAAAVGAAVLVVAAIWFGQPPAEAARPAPTAPATVPAADPPTHFEPGDRWVGTFRFLDGEGRPAGGEFPVSLRITSRSGAAFGGEYATETGYRWEVSGKAEGGKVEWALTRALTAQATKTKAAGSATVSGSYAGGVLSARYRDHDSVADMTLRPAAKK